MGNGVSKINNLSGFLKDFLNLLYPERLNCIFCGKPLKRYNEYTACGYCRSMLKFTGERTCRVCGRILMEDYEKDTCSDCLNSSPYFDGACSVFIFEGIIQAALYRLKYDGDTGIAPVIGKYMAKRLIQTGWPVDLIIPVPLHDRRLAERRFNQSYLLSLEIGRECGVSVSDTVLKRIRHTESQVSLSKLDRTLNVRGAFDIADRNSVEGRSILIVDDIITTGATLNECSKAIRGYGAKNVYCLAAASPIYAK
jgi:Predicted amidophosphoribosyltransferases